MALTGFQYSTIDKSIEFKNRKGTWFWSNGYSRGICEIAGDQLILSLIKGELDLNSILLDNKKIKTFKSTQLVQEGSQIYINLN